MKRNLCLLTMLAIALAGCSPVQYQESADEETYGIIGEKQEEVFGEPYTGFTIEKQPLPEFIREREIGEEPPKDPAKQTALVGLSEETIVALREEFREAKLAETGKEPTEEEIEVKINEVRKLLSGEFSDKVLEDLDDDRKLGALLILSYDEIADWIIPPPPDAVKLTLDQALDLAVANSREFQSQKESLFLRALGLTLQRHLWRPQLGWTGSASWQKEGGEESVKGQNGLSLGQAIATGADLALNLGTSLLEFLTGDKRKAAESVLSLSILQPLLRGSGRLVAMENLTQAERDVIYQVRSFARFRKSFSVNAADSYYQVLQDRDSLVNTFRNYISLRRGTLRDEELRARGRISSLNVLQSRQDELQSKNNAITARQQYLDKLDRLKINPLGLPPEARIVLDDRELDILRSMAADGLPLPPVEQERAGEVALSSRLDLMTAEDALEDSERAVAIARDALRAGLDLSFSANAGTEPPTKALKFELNDADYSAGLSFDLPIDRKQERNAYRAALIALESQKRSLSLLRDNIKLEVREAYRVLDQARKSHEIQKVNVGLAETRVDNAELEHEVGTATTRDVLEAKDALLSAQNALTGALVNHEIARLNLLLSTEQLQVDHRGLWDETQAPERGDEDVGTTE